MSVTLSTSLQAVLRTTSIYLDALKEMEIETVEDLLLYLPRSYEDVQAFQTLATAPLNAKVTLRGTIENLKLIHTRSRKKIVKGQFIDTEGGIAEVIWFNQPHIKRMIREGQDIVLTGKLIDAEYGIAFQSPQIESPGKTQPVHGGRLVPIYPQHDIITTKWLREKIVLLKDAIAQFEETLPQWLVEEEKLMSRTKAIEALHFPEEGKDIQSAQNRMAFEDLFFVQKSALEQKKEWQGERNESLRIPMDIELIRAFFESLKFTPTGSQKIAIYEILKDMEQDVSMSRLLEGDVGSGKTLVATAVMANTLRHGGQCALMVPTEVLAKQHAENISKVLLNFHTYLFKEKKNTFEWRLPHLELLTGSVTASKSHEIKQGLMNGTVDIVIGTHALIEENVQFKNLKLVVVDEQHRFGVEQRRKLKEKGSPHFLAMTATPIPRTLALTAFGHHDLSVLLEKPGNRKLIHTKVVPPKDRVIVERFIDQQIEEGRQVFVICPLITESTHEEMQEIKSVENESKRLKESFPSRRIALLHGKMLPQEKDDIMKKFKAKEYDILVSTSVIEVGIDVPNATVMIIEGAERFGLAQLHQFRGRVGRSDHQSHCFLFTSTTAQVSPRLKAMEKHDSGFELAEIDMRMRGPGEMWGLRQSGIPEMRFGGLFEPELVVRARRAAEKFLERTATTA